MKTVYINREVKNHAWGGGAHFVRSFVNLANENNFKLISKEQLLEGVKPDYVFIAGLDQEDGHPSAEQITNHFFGSSTKIIYRVNDCDARKGTQGVDKRIRKISHQSNGIIYVSEWMKEYHSNVIVEGVPGIGTRKIETCVIRNGVDHSWFSKPKTLLDYPKVRIAAHHWSSHSLKGADVYEQLDEWISDKLDRYSFTYIGRTESKFKNTLVIPPLFGKAMGDVLVDHDVYISGSRWDPGPNHCIEALAANLKTYVHKDGGGCVEFAGSDYAYSSFEELTTWLEDDLCRVKGLGVVPFKQPTQDTWEDCIKKVYSYIDNIQI